MTTTRTQSNNVNCPNCLRCGSLHETGWYSYFCFFDIRGLCWKLFLFALERAERTRVACGCRSGADWAFRRFAFRILFNSPTPPLQHTTSAQRAFHWRRISDVHPLQLYVRTAVHRPLTKKKFVTATIKTYLTKRLRTTVKRKIQMRSFLIKDVA